MKKLKKDVIKYHKNKQNYMTNEEFYDGVIDVTSNVAGLLDNESEDSDETSEDSADENNVQGLECFGGIRSTILGAENFYKKISSHEVVTLVRVPNNTDDHYAVEVKNRSSERVGYIEVGAAKPIAQILERNLAKVEGFVKWVTMKFCVPVDVSFWGAPADREKVLYVLYQNNITIYPVEPVQRRDFLLSAPSSATSTPTTMGYGHVISSRMHIISSEQMQTELNKIFETLEEGDHTTEAEPSTAIVTPLYPHQKQALNWMICKENKDDLPPFWKKTETQYINSLTLKKTTERPASVRGGILADDMGLGKTLQMISLIITNDVDGKPSVEPVKKKANPLERWLQADLDLPINKDNVKKARPGQRQKVVHQMASSSSSSLSPNSDQKTKSTEHTVSDSKKAAIKTTDVQAAFSVELKRMMKRASRSAIDEDGDQMELLPSTKKVKTEVQRQNNATDGYSSTSTVSPSSSRMDLTLAFSSDDEKSVPLQMSPEPVEKETLGWSSSSSSPLLSLKSTFAKRSKQKTPSPSSTDNSDVIVIEDSDDELSDVPDEVEVSPPTCSSQEKNADDLSVDAPVEVSYKNKADRLEPKTPRGTLIICPVSVISNWDTQFWEHVDKRADVTWLKYHGPKRPKDATHLKKFDVVITSYSVVTSDFKSTSPLHEIDWLRIVLDEGHCIKNPKTKTAKAVCELKAERRWVLTGTPIQNSLKDLWSLICFLQVKPFTHIGWWNHTIAGPIFCGQEPALKRLAHLVGHLTLRRTKNQQLHGKPLIELPARDVYIEKIRFSEKERKMYDDFEQQGRTDISRYFQEGVVLDMSIFTTILRLRQICCHPCLYIEGVKKKAAAAGDITDKGGNKDETNCNNSEEDQDLIEAERKSLLEKLRTFIASGSEEDLECPICLESNKQIVITWCAHIFCKDCIMDVINKDKPNALCPSCRANVDEDKLVEAPTDLENRQKDYEEPENENILGPDHGQSSAKIDALKKALTELRQKDPSVKSLVVSQFTSYLNLIGTALAMEGFKYTRFDGSMKVDYREAAIRDFSRQEPDSPTIMLLSLKAGGVGINLTAASRVFLMDTAWNPAAEEQCFDRCHRLGQTRDVVITRLVIENSIEERMLALQEKKKHLINAAFQKKPTKEQQRADRIKTIKTLMKI